MQSKSKRQPGYFVGYSCPYELNNLSNILRNQKQLCLYICFVLGLLITKDKGRASFVDSR
jgi:hypothetical protein